MEYLIHLIQSAGYFGYVILFLIIFLESFPVTFFFPGDSLLFTMGFMASTGALSLPILIAVFFTSGTLGYFGSYFFGKWIKDIIYSEKDTFWFRRKYFLKTRDFYDKYGSKTIVIGRFVPIVRSFGPALAGAVEMDFIKFSKYAVMGVILWSFGVTLAGFYLGELFPNTKLYLTPIIVAVVFVSVLPGVIEYIKIKWTKSRKMKS